MKVLMTADCVGGVWTYACELCAALSEHDISIALATMGGPLTHDQRSEVARLPNVTLYESEYQLEWMHDPWDDVARAGDWLMEIASRVRPDLVHLNNFVHGALPWSAPVLMVGHSCVCSWFRAVRRQEAGGEWSRYRREVGTGLRSAPMVIAPTWAMLLSLEEHYGPFRHTRVIANARDPRQYRPGPKQPFILAAGRLWDDAKNIATLARAATDVVWPIRIAGEHRHPDGGEVEWASVELLGPLPPRRLAEQMSTAAIYALPVRYEPFGLSVLEAALAGCALVLGDIPSLREVWGDAAEFVTPDDAAELADTLNRLLADPPRLHERAVAALGRAREYTPERLGREYRAAYDDLLRRERANDHPAVEEASRCTS